jgi:hypothetical protein
MAEVPFSALIGLKFVGQVVDLVDGCDSKQLGVELIIVEICCEFVHGCLECILDEGLWCSHTDTSSTFLAFI